MRLTEEVPTPSRPIGSSPSIYLDHHATTPVDPRVAKVVLHAMTEAFGNANSADHQFGETAAALVANARESVALLAGADVLDVRFTSGSTEAIRLAVMHAHAKRPKAVLRVAMTRVEHRAVLDAVANAARTGLVEFRWIDVDDQARVSLDSIGEALTAGVDLLCVMAANNEVGTVYPISTIAAQAHSARAAVLVDATQAAGRLPLKAREWGIDYLAISAHKLYGPKGVGALIAPGAAREAADSLFGYAGTPNVPGISGFGEACRLRCLEMGEDESRIAALRDYLESTLLASIDDLVVNGDRNHRLSHNLHVSVPGVPNDAVVARLRRTVAISTGAACSSGAQTPSHVLRAMGLPAPLQEGALRMGLGKFNTRDEIDRAAAEIANAISAVRSHLKGHGH